EGAHRLRGTSRHRKHHSADVTLGLPARRVPARAWDDRPHRCTAADEGDAEDFARPPGGRRSVIHRSRRPESRRDTQARAPVSGGSRGLVSLLARLAERARRGMELGLDPTRRALAELGNPHLGLPVVHVAGTNGKGSVCAMIESIARAAGLRTGLASSPHLCRLAEVIRLDGEPIADEAFEQSLERALGASSALTFFEALTVTALHALPEAQVDRAISEVGLGGARDATNVLDAPLVTAITAVALEHTAVLGGSIDLIAREKAGIIKPGAPIVTGPLVPVAAEVMREMAQERC